MNPTAAAAAETPWWEGLPTTLKRKQTLVPGIPTTEALEPGSTTSLPVHTLTFAIPDALDPDDPEEDGKPRYSGKARRHDTLRMELGDVVKMVIPGYKPKSYSLSDLRKAEGEFDITIKVYPSGRASGFLDRLRIGDTIGSFGIRKAKIRNLPTSPSSPSTTPTAVGLIAYGVGITEAWPIAKAELDRSIDDGRADRVVLVWASRTPKDTFWNDQLEDYQRKHPERFELIRIYSRERVEGCRHGRIDAGVLAEIFQTKAHDDPTAAAAAAATTTTRFLSVGTKAMMKRTDEMLASIGFSMPEHALLASSKP